MTIREIAHQLHRLSVVGYFNGEKFSEKELRGYLEGMFRPGVHLKAGNSVIMEISLPDGNWFFSVSRFSDSRDGYDYWIPDNKEEEGRILSRLMD